MKLVRIALGLAVAGVLAWLAVPRLHAWFAGPKPSQIPDASFLFREDALPKRASRLTPEDVDTDVSFLLSALDRAYSGKEHLPPGEYPRLVARLEALRGLFAKPQEDHAGDQLCLKIAEIFSQVPDSHLQTDSPFNQQFRPRQWDVGPNVFQGTGFHITEQRLAGRIIGVVSLGTSMPPLEDAAWKGFEARVDKVCQRTDALVLDLRGNRGGMSDNIRWLASRLYGNSVRMADEILLERKSATTMALNYNLVTVQMLKARTENRTIQDYQRDEQTQSFKYCLAWQGLPPREERSVRAGSQAPFDPKRGYNKPVRILIDRATASSAEGGYARFLSHPKLKTFGANTGGYIHYGDLGLLVLPRSSIVVGIPTSFRTFSDGRFLEKVGYPPDVRVPDGEDALKVALADLAHSWSSSARP